MVALRDACFSVVPGPLRRLAPVLDRLSSSFLARTPSPYTDEIAAISDLAAGGGVWFVNLTNFMDGIDWMTVAEAIPVAGAIILLGLLGLLDLIVGWTAIGSFFLVFGAAGALRRAAARAGGAADRYEKALFHRHFSGILCYDMKF